MLNFKIFVLLLTIVNGTRALDCLQIPETQVSAGNTVYIPGPSAGLQTLPANFDCLYRITVPTTETSGLYANVTVLNGMKGVNDFIRVLDATNERHTLDSRQGNATSTYFVIPGAEITVQVATKSVLMNSQFGITVGYHTAHIGNTVVMKTGGEMNYFDMANTRNGKSTFSSITFSTEQWNEQDGGIFFTTVSDPRWPVACDFCYVIDGNMTYQWETFHLLDAAVAVGFATTTNQITFVSFQDGHTGIVLNTGNESHPYKPFTAVAAIPNNPYYGNSQNYPEFTTAIEVINPDSTGIRIKGITVWTDYCNAYIVSGPPNNSSKFLMNIETRIDSKSFDLKSLTIINHNCTFHYAIEGYVP